MNAKLQLISPPPEETLNLTSKRKRDSAIQPPITTPNPKPRKQLKHRSRPSSQNAAPDSPSKSLTPSKSKRVLVQSPHATNPDADYIPPAPLDLLSSAQRRSVFSARSSTRSATPIPPYEPPPDVFTPPKEVFVTATIRVTKSSKRKSTKKKKSKPAPVVVKLEMPDVDLDAPMPPPSPGDDPLLLSSLDLVSTPTRPKRKPSWIAFSESDLLTMDKPVNPAPARRTASPAPLFTKLRFDDLPPSSPPNDELGQPSPIIDDPADLDITPVHMPFFDLADAGAVHNESWSDSDDDCPGDRLPVSSNHPSEGEGEFTGKWKELLVRTKVDPPSSVTRCRIENWGNPKSPFPERKRTSQESYLELVQEIREEQFELHPQSDDDEKEEEEVRRMSVEPEPGEPEPEGPQINYSRPEEGEEESEANLINSGQAADTDYFVSLREDEGYPRPGMPLLMDAVQQHVYPQTPGAEDAFKLMGNQPTIGGEQDSKILHDEPKHTQDSPLIQTKHTDRARLDGTDDDEPSSNSDMDEADIVKITSADPRAAARAAAILKQHDYDCFTKLELKRRHSEAVRARSSTPSDLSRDSNRKDVSLAGIHKKDRRRNTLTTGVIGDSVFIPGSPATTLPQLLQKAEAEVCQADHPTTSTSPRPFPSRHTNLFRTPLPAKARSVTPRLPMTPGEMCYDPLTGERLWTREEWKRLDACFTDERWDISQRLSLGMVSEDGLASVDLVRIEDVVERFVDWMGGWEAVDGYGPLWSREKLMQRASALQNKQRSGNSAPPTIPLTPRIQSPVLNYRPAMDIPEFTPIRRRVPYPKRQWTSIVPVEECLTLQSPPVPATLLAPRYLHLLEETTAVSKEAPRAVDEDVDVPEPESTQDDRKEAPALEPSTVGERVKGLIFSYLPTLKNRVPLNPLKYPAQPSLPPPPKEVFEKPRGPVRTPAREPLPKLIHPKELVHLQQAPPPPPPASKIPRIVPPKQLVELHPPPPKPMESRPQPRLRRSSGASIKDLIQGFEEMENQSRAEVGPGEKAETRWKKSVGEWRNGTVGRNGTRSEGGKPMWKP